LDPDSYGYRPGKSATGAGAVRRQRGGQDDWVVEVDRKGACDTLDPGRLLKAGRKQRDCRWVVLYGERWVQAPTLSAAGEEQARQQGTPHGGVRGPLVLTLVLP
jgi:RNA-directed DNA polymerase